LLGEVFQVNCGAEIFWQLPTKNLADSGMESPRILLLGEDESFCLLMERAARKKGMRLKTCSDLESFQRAISHSSFDSIVIDYHSGPISGDEVAETLGDLPSIVVTRPQAGENKKPNGRELRIFNSGLLSPRDILEAANTIDAIEAIDSVSSFSVT
jgi:CheY-like chemotaxis protein